jgi:pyruvate,water dikinase
MQLAKWACQIEEHYSKLAGQAPNRWTSNGAKDGVTGELFILQARPETIHGQNTQNFIEKFQLSEGHGAPLVSGVAVGEKIGHGTAHVLRDSTKLTAFKEGEILVTSMTDPLGSR